MHRIPRRLISATVFVGGRQDPQATPALTYPPLRMIAHVGDVCAVSAAAQKEQAGLVSVRAFEFRFRSQRLAVAGAGAGAGVGAGVCAFPPCAFVVCREELCVPC